MPASPLLGPAIRAARKTNKVGLRELARLAEVSPSYLSRLETGDATGASMDVLMNISSALGRPPAPLNFLGGVMGLGDLLTIHDPTTFQVIPDWTADDAQRIEDEDFAPELIEKLAYGLFVHVRLENVLASYGFADDYAALLDSLNRAGDRRWETILAFAEEQAVLGELDRRESNPARRRLVGELYDPALQARIAAIRGDLQHIGEETAS